MAALSYLAPAATMSALLLLLLLTTPQALPHGLLCIRAPEQEKASTEHMSAAAMARMRRAMILLEFGPAITRAAHAKIPRVRDVRR